MLPAHILALHVNSILQSKRCMALCGDVTYVSVVEGHGGPKPCKFQSLPLARAPPEAIAVGVEAVQVQQMRGSLPDGHANFRSHFRPVTCFRALTNFVNRPVT